jgi:nucleotide-binding universal stress UspA family protein
MAMRVLVPVDDDERGERAVELAANLFPDGTVVLFHVINPSEAGFSTEEMIPSFPDGWYEQEKAQAKELLDDLADLADERGVAVERHVEIGRPARVVLTAVEKYEIDHVVMGSRGRKGVSRILLGSIAETVVRRSDVPVTVAR